MTIEHEHDCLVEREITFTISPTRHSYDRGANYDW